MTVTVTAILDVVSEYYDVPIVVISSGRRSTKAVKARRVAMHLALQMTSLSSVEIGKEFGGRDHATVLGADKAIAQDSIEGSALRSEVLLLKERVLNHKTIDDEVAIYMEALDLDALRDALARKLRKENSAPIPDIKQQAQISAAIKSTDLAQSQPKNVSDAIIQHDLMNPDGAFCKAAAAVSIAALEAEQAKHTVNENLAKQKMEKAAIAFAKEYHKIRPTLGRTI